jgi:hypothetical protein
MRLLPGKDRAGWLVVLAVVYWWAAIIVFGFRCHYAPHSVPDKWTHVVTFTMPSKEAQRVAYLEWLAQEVARVQKQGP